MNARRQLAQLVIAAVTGLVGPAASAAAEPTATPPADPAAKTPKVAVSVSNPLAPRFKQVRERIEALYQHRNQSPPPIDSRTNPFRPPGVGGGGGAGLGGGATPSGLPGGSDLPAGEAAVGKPSVPVANADETLVQQAAATLKISGVFEIAGRSHLVINARPYSQGDVVQTQLQGETVYLRIKEIKKRSVTFTLRDAEMILSF